MDWGTATAAWTRWPWSIKAEDPRKMGYQFEDEWMKQRLVCGKGLRAYIYIYTSHHRRSPSSVFCMCLKSIQSIPFSPETLILVQTVTVYLIIFVHRLHNILTDDKTWFNVPTFALPSWTDASHEMTEGIHPHLILWINWMDNFNPFLVLCIERSMWIDGSTWPGEEVKMEECLVVLSEYNGFHTCRIWRTFVVWGALN